MAQVNTVATTSRKPVRGMRNSNHPHKNAHLRHDRANSTVKKVLLMETLRR